MSKVDGLIALAAVALLLKALEGASQQPVRPSGGITTRLS